MLIAVSDRTALPSAHPIFFASDTNRSLQHTANFLFPYPNINPYFFHFSQTNYNQAFFFPPYVSVHASNFLRMVFSVRARFLCASYFPRENRPCCILNLREKRHCGKCLSLPMHVSCMDDVMYFVLWSPLCSPFLSV